LLGSIVLAGVLLKLGGYGVYRAINYYYISCFFILWRFSSFSLLGAFYIRIVCLRQLDIKSIIAYSSIVHIGPVFSSIFLIVYYNLMGAYTMMMSHGICSSALFLLLDIVYKRMRTRSFFVLRGGLKFFPILSFFWFFLCARNIGCPPTFNFFSELFITVSSFFFQKIFFFIVFYSYISDWFLLCFIVCVS